MKTQYLNKHFPRKFIFSLLALMIIGSNMSFGQSKTNANFKNLLKTDISILGDFGIGLSYELAMKKNSTIEFSGGLGAVYGIVNGQSGARLGRYDYGYYLQSQYKYFYNLRKRIKKGKTTKNNSGDYLGISFRLTTRDITRWENSAIIFPNTTGHTSLFWGFQRPIDNRFLFDFNIGGHHVFDFESRQTRLFPIAQLRFSFIISLPKIIRN